MSENTLKIEKLVPEFKFEGKTYSLKSTRYLRVLFEKETDKRKENVDKLTDEQSIKLMEYNNLINDLGQIKEKFENAKQDYWDDVTNKEKKAVYLGLKEIYEETLEQIKNGKEQMELMNKATAETLDIYEKMIIEALIEQHNMSQKDATALWEGFVDTIGKDAARDYVFAIGDELFNSSYEVEDNSFLSQKQKKLKMLIENSKKKNKK